MGQRLAGGGGVGGSLTRSGEGGQLSSGLLVLLLGLVGDGTCSKLWVSNQQRWQHLGRSTYRWRQSRRHSGRLERCY